MRKFKLIKEYPGSTTLGTIAQPHDLLQHDFFEKYSEFWQEVIEKDFEILISRVVPQKILSIKRLSDGEVFTVGDKFKANIGDREVIRTIQKIQVEGDAINIQHENGDLTNRKGVGIFHQIRKIKQPIFLTHDGKDIFEGDTVWWVRKDSTSIIGRLIVPPGEKFNSDMTAYFLTQEAAEDYIEKNKVLFTTEDGVEVRYGDEVWWVTSDSKIMREAKWDGGNKCYESNKYYSTRAAAENYVVQKSHSLSIEDFWEFDSWGGSNIAKSKRLKRLVKERLNLQ